MQKVRKNSLSPCYSTSNKVNVQIQNLVTPVGISFKTLEQARKKKIIDLEKDKPAVSNRTPTHIDHFIKPSYTPNPGVDTSQRQRQSRKQSDKSIEQFRSSLKSKEKQMGSLQSQVNTLNSTVSLLKDQLTNLKNQNKTLHQENSQHKRIIKEKNEIIQKLKESQNNKVSISSLFPNQIKNYESLNSHKISNKNILTDYDQFNEKLNELEEIQEKLLQENQQLKKKQELSQAMFKNIKALLLNRNTQQILDLLDVLQDNNGSSEYNNNKQNVHRNANNNTCKNDGKKEKVQNLGNSSSVLKKHKFKKQRSIYEEGYDFEGEELSEDDLFFEKNPSKIKKSRAKGYYGNQRM